MTPGTPGITGIPGTRGTPAPRSKSGRSHRCAGTQASHHNASIRLWTAVVSYRGIIELAESAPTQAKARARIIRHLRRLHDYNGPAAFSSAVTWLSERDDCFEVQVFSQRIGLSALAVARPPRSAPVDQIVRHLRGDGFIVLTGNRSAGESDARFEAWAYQGPVNFDLASPLHFGRGADPSAALAALNQRFAHTAK